MKKIIIFILVITTLQIFAQNPVRRGSTTANFLEIGFGSRGISMGDAVVSDVNDISSIYWNVAGLGFMEKPQIMLYYQPWIANIDLSFVAAGLVLKNIGTIAFAVYNSNYGEMEVTSMELQEGTGETFAANDYCMTLSFGRRITSWFAFGYSAKFISSKIWHSYSKAFATDLGVIIKTPFLSPTGKNLDGLSIGMNISNYGTEMKYSGMDLLETHDPYPNENGNYKDVPVEYKTNSWELPLIFRIGFSIHPIATSLQRLTLSLDALHPNNNYEYVNLGTEYKYTIPSFGSLYLRTGYKGLFLKKSQYGFSFGFGILYNLMFNKAISIEYSYREVGVLGYAHSYSVNFIF